jgi:ZIP family zinc transporter
MGQALVFGVVASLPLVAGALIGSRVTLPEHVYAMLLGFAGGALISALAFELFAEAHERGGVWRAAIGLVLGATVFVLVDAFVLEGARGSAASFGLLAAVTLDGVPENVALGVSLVEGASYTLLLAIFFSNLPESLVGAVAMRDEGRPPREAIVIWGVCALVLAVAVVLGRAAFAGADEGLLAVCLAFAGGAVLASLADTLMPEAFEHGRPFNSFATAAGFFLSFMLATV